MNTLGNKCSSQVVFFLYLPLPFFVWLFLLYFGVSLPATSILVLVSIFYIVASLSKVKVDYYCIGVFFCIALILLYVVSYYAFFGDFYDNSNRSLIYYNIVIVIMYFFSYFAGRNMLFVGVKIKLYAYVLMCVFVILNTDFQLYTLDLSHVDVEYSGLYLGLSDIYCLVSFFLIGGGLSNRSKILIFVMSLVLLYILNSRASLYVFVFVSVIYFSMILRLRVVAMLVIFSFVMLLLFFNSIASFSYSENRMLKLLISPSDDPSNIERMMMFDSGIDQIFRNVFWGDYGGVIKLYGDLGSYMHNIFSYWQNFGLVIFVFSLWFFVVHPIKAFLLIVFDGRKYLRVNGYVFLLSIYLIVMMVLSKSYTWYYSWFILGVLHSYFRFRSARFDGQIS